MAGVLMRWGVDSGRHQRRGGMRKRLRAEGCCPSPPGTPESHAKIHPGALRGQDPAATRTLDVWSPELGGRTFLLFQAPWFVVTC